MRGLPTDSGFPEELHVDLDEFRNLVMKYSCAKPDRIELAVEYVGGRIKVYEVYRFLIECLLQQLEYRAHDLYVTRFPTTRPTTSLPTPVRRCWKP